MASTSATMVMVSRPASAHADNTLASASPSGTQAGTCHGGPPRNNGHGPGPTTPGKSAAGEEEGSSAPLGPGVILLDLKQFIFATGNHTRLSETTGVGGRW